MPIQPSDRAKLVEDILSKRGCKANTVDCLHAFAQGVQAAVDCLSPIASLDKPASPSAGQSEGGPESC